MLAAVMWCVLVAARAATGAGAPSGQPEGPCGPLSRAARADEARREPAAPSADSRGAHDALLEALAGARGGNRLVVCGGCRERAGGARGPCLARRCPAVLWRRRWALVRASCTEGLALADLRVLRSVSQRACDALQRDPAVLEGGARRAVWAAMQPLAHQGDLYDAELIRLDHCFDDDQPLANDTTAMQHLQHVRYWMEEIEEFYRKTTPEQNITQCSYTLFVVVVLPLAILFLVFLFVTFGTGSPIKVPYSNEKEGITTPWMIHGYSSDAKCFPSNGQV